MPMNPRLLRPIASGVHPEAAAWRSAVVANGGSVSATTMRAVSKFCADIDAAGIRDRFYRLNLFAGTGLSAALVPLYRGPTRTGTQYGNTTDTNVNFVSGDYVESVGLTGTGNNGVGAGNSKYLRTNLRPANIGLFSGHLSVWARGLTTALPNQAGLIAIRDNGPPTQFWALEYRQSNTVANYSGAFVTMTTPTGNRLVLLSRVSATDLRHYADASQSGSTQTTDISAATTRDREWSVFATNTDGVFGGFFAGTLGSYSAGLGMTAGQVSDYNAAVQSFQSAMGRA